MHQFQFQPIPILSGNWLELELELELESVGIGIGTCLFIRKFLPIEILLFQNCFFNFSMREQLYFLSLV